LHYLCVECILCVIEQALEKQLLVEQCQRVKQRNSDLAVSAEQLSSQLSVCCEWLNNVVGVLNTECFDVVSGVTGREVHLVRKKSCSDNSQE